MIVGLEITLASSYDFSKVISCCKELVAASGRFIPLLVQVLKVGNLFGSKQTPTRKFAIGGLTGTANWVF
jgi:hypothetical protein